MCVSTSLIIYMLMHLNITLWRFDDVFVWL